MRVKELIETLKRYPQDLEILIEEQNEEAIGIGGVTIQKATDAQTSEDRSFVVIKKPAGGFHVI